MHSPLYQKLMNSKQWKALRAQVLTESPLCEVCKANGYVRAARCVHHVIPIESGRTDADCERLAFNRQNLQALCFECHANIHKAERSHSTAAHKQRQAERLERWKQKHLSK